MQNRVPEISNHPVMTLRLRANDDCGHLTAARYAQVHLGGFQDHTTVFRRLLEPRLAYMLNIQRSDVRLRPAGLIERLIGQFGSSLASRLGRD